MIEATDAEESKQTAKLASHFDRKPAMGRARQPVHRDGILPVRDTDSRIVSAHPSRAAEKPLRLSVHAEEEVDHQAVAMEPKVMRPSQPSDKTDDRYASESTTAAARKVSAAGQSVRSLASDEREAGSARNLNDAPAGNTVHIGNVDIQIMPLAMPPVKQPARQSVSSSVPVLSRGFVSAFGLRQA